MDDINGLCDRVREIAFALHVYLGPGHLETVYENGLAHRLRKGGIDVEHQARLAVYDEDGQLLGSYAADLLIDKRLIVELKAVSRLNTEHAAQIIGYLKASRLRHGLLINFGAAVFAIRKFKN
jgi:GxxExxY protein